MAQLSALQTFMYALVSSAELTGDHSESQKIESYGLLFFNDIERRSENRNINS